METDTTCQDVMQVCRNGHVITDLLTTFPDRAATHCERCGATTIDRCTTCGRPIQGAIHVVGLTPIGKLEPPAHCSGCGASFPWTTQPSGEIGKSGYPFLEQILRRLPRVIRQLRVRQADRPAFRVYDERDLEDLMRAILPLHYDDVRPECRTALYAPATSTDFIIASQSMVLTVKRSWPHLGERQLTAQFEEDVAYYDLRDDGRMLVGFVYDPEGLLREPRKLETQWSKLQADLEIRCVIAT